MPPPGYEVDPEKLDEAARSLDGLATDISSARSTLLNDGALPTLDPLSKAMGAVSIIQGGPIGPLIAPLATLAGMAISEEIDPYPPIRNAWLDALERYRKLMVRNAQGVRDTVEDYRQSELTNTGRFDDDTYPTPTVPGKPTVPMPTHPGEPAAPMPRVRPGPGESGPVDI